MADSNNEKKKPNFFKGVKREFKKITWPTRNDVFKQTVLVTVITVFCSALIAGIDYLAKLGIDALIKL
ncbi:MAG: preprotein translocase subunit SecE [Lachnospiraceae bacterium]|jgi:preprotein translocase subunit SecE|nr:preprotein translocase subunit SecE [Lachnospiraceae bacterium]MBQ6637158.1 preprotein translocase subunit SecE [Lachnospiraceae bacterium]MBR3638833.1 preprotein translocase subunit SecE [Lachnospiraceae bacterium]